MRPVPPAVSARIESLLAASERALGLLLCVHEWVPRSGLDPRWRQHRSPACLGHKRSGDLVCDRHCGGRVHAEAEARPLGSIHTCPFGHSEVVVPIHWQGWYVGVLFAGTCFLEQGTPPHPDLVVPEEADWLPSRVTVLHAVAQRFASLLEGEPSYQPPDRRARIQAFLQQHVDRPVSLDDLAQELSLSPSRTAHLVTSIFGQPLSQLARSIKLGEAARLLASTSLPVAEVAALVGYPDQNYFSRLFRASYDLPPLRYRQRYLV